MNKGWLKIHRSLIENPIWQDKPFSKGQAWIDLLIAANYSESQILIGNKMEKVYRGELITSEKRLMERWGWSKNKVRNFLSLLQEEKMIEREANNKRTVIRIVKYEYFQSSQTREEEKENRKETKRIYGEYHHVRLTDDEFNRLQKDYGEEKTQEMIKRLDEYLENNKRKKYDNHNLTIRKWLMKDGVKKIKARKEIQSVEQQMDETISKEEDDDSQEWLNTKEMAPEQYENLLKERGVS